MKTISLLFAILSLGHAAWLFSNTFGDNMVLQQAPSSANVYGKTTPGASVTARIAGVVTVTVNADTTGFWVATFPPQQGTYGFGGYRIEATSSTGDFSFLNNVQFGDVYVCAGEENMQMTVSQIIDGGKEIADSGAYSTGLRVFTATGNGASKPRTSFEQVTQNWTAASPSSIGGMDWKFFSGICYEFGKNLHDQLKIRNNPTVIGLISASYPGSQITSWMSKDAINQCPQSSHGVGSFPSDLWNGMVNPLLNMRIKGAIWYQGVTDLTNPVYYKCAFAAMIQDWRIKWNSDAEKMFYFGFVQMSPLPPSRTSFDDKIAFMRLAQSSAISLPKVGFASAVDLGDYNSPYGAVFPRDKIPLGFRLAFNALYITYNIGLEAFMGPWYTGWTYDSQTTIATITFWDITVGRSLYIGDASKVCPPEIAAGQCRGLEISNSTNNWIPVDNMWVGDLSIKFVVPNGFNIQNVRYGYGAWPKATIFNINGWPAAPFNTQAQ